MAKGQEGLTGNVLKQAKAVATMEMIFERSKDAQTGFAEGSDSLTRKMREMSARVQELMQAVQIQLTPSFLELIKAITEEVLPVLEKDLADEIAKLIKAFAETLPGALEVTKDIFVATAEVSEQLAGAFQKLRGATTDIEISPTMWIAFTAAAGLALAAIGTLGLALTATAAAAAVVTTVYTKIFSNLNKDIEEDKSKKYWAEHAEELDQMIWVYEQAGAAAEHARKLILANPMEWTNTAEQIEAVASGVEAMGNEFSNTHVLDEYWRALDKVGGHVGALAEDFEGLSFAQMASTLAAGIFKREQAGQIHGIDQMNAEIDYAIERLKFFWAGQADARGQAGLISHMMSEAGIGKNFTTRSTSMYGSLTNNPDEEEGNKTLDSIRSAAENIESVAQGNTEAGRFGFNLSPGTGLLGAGGSSTGGTANNVFQAFRMAQETMGFAMDSQRAKNVAQTLGHQLFQQLDDAQMDLRTDYQRIADIGGVNPQVTDKSIKIFLSVNELADPIAIGDKIMEILSVNPNYLAGEIFGGREI